MLRYTWLKLGTNKKSEILLNLDILRNNVNYKTDKLLKVLKIIGHC